MARRGDPREKVRRPGCSASDSAIPAWRLGPAAARPQGWSGRPAPRDAPRTRRRPWPAEGFEVLAVRPRAGRWTTRPPRSSRHQPSAGLGPARWGEGDPGAGPSPPGRSRLWKALDWLGYLSTTGVYGDRGRGLGRRGLGADARPASGAAAGWRRRRAWLELLGTGRPAGPPLPAGRHLRARPQRPRQRCGPGTAKRIDKPGQVFSRIHVDRHRQRAAKPPSPGPAPGADLQSSATTRPPRSQRGDRLCLRPARPGAAAAGALRGKPSSVRHGRAPSTGTTSGSPTRRIKEELGVRLAYPDLPGPGLNALLARRGRVVTGGEPADQSAVTVSEEALEVGGAPTGGDRRPSPDGHLDVPLTRSRQSSEAQRGAAKAQPSSSMPCRIRRRGQASGDAARAAAGGVRPSSMRAQGDGVGLLVL